LKLLVVSSRFPYPVEKGDKLRLYNQLKILSKHFEVYLFSCTTSDIKEKSKKEIKKYCKEIEIYEIGNNEVITNLTKAFFGGLPFQVGLYTNPTIRNRIKKMVKAQQIEHVYCQLIRMAENVKYLNIPKTIDFMDAFGFGMEQRKQRGSIFSKWIYGQESKRTKKFEKNIYEYFGAHTIITAQDRDRLPMKSEAVTVVQNGVNVKFFENKGFMEEYDLIFIGNMGYIPNVNAAKYLCEKIQPAISKKANKEYSVFIAGARPTNEVIDLTKNEQVTVAGWLEDIRTGYEAGRYFVAPIFNGIGQQNKILEALSMEKPCIINQSVADGIGLIHEQHCLIANTVDEFVESILRLENDPILLAKIIVNGKELVQNNFRWKQQTSKLIEVIKNNQKTGQKPSSL